MSISGAINVAVSGLNSASDRLNNSASNIANIRSVAAPADETVRAGQELPTTNANGDTIFRPTEVQSTTTASGGVKTQTSLISPSSIPVYDPTAADANEDGVSSIPNVSVESETVNQILAQRQFEANVALLQTSNELLEETIDIVA